MDGSNKFANIVGNIGLGSTQPTATLDVNGTVNVSGVSTFTSTVEITPSSNVKGLVIDSTSASTNSNPHITLRGNGPQSIDFRDSGSGNGDGLKIAYRTNPNQFAVENSENATTHFLVDRDDGRVELNYGGSKKFETVGGGVSISSGTASTATIYGPGNLIIDPAPVDDNGGIVRIKGDFYVDGTTTEINSTTLTIDDLNVVVASGATNSIAADGAGITVDGASATLQYASTGDKWVFNKAPYYNTFRILTTADEGPGHGIDADTLDGQEGTYYLDYSNFVGIATDSSLLSGISSTSFLRSDVADIKTSGNLKFNDGVQLRFGTDNDLQLYHSGTASMIVNTGTGNLRIRNSVDLGDVVIQTDDGSGGSTDYFRADGSTGEAILYHYGAQKLATKSTGIDVTGHTETDTLNVSGISTFNDDVTFDGATAGRDITFDRSNNALEFEDNAKAIFGSGTDNLSIYHNGANSYISNDGNDSGSIYIQATKDGERVHIRSDNGSGGTADYFAAYGNTGEARLYHYGNQKFANKSNGIDVTGHTETDTLNVSGNSTITGILTASEYRFPDYGNTNYTCLLYTSPSPRDRQKSRMPSSA